MGVELWMNNARSSLAAAIDDDDTSLSVASGQGSRFPNPTGGDYFWATIDNGTVDEIVKVTARSTDTFTIVRGQQGKTARAWNTGTRIENRVTKETLEDLQVSAGAAVAVDTIWDAKGDLAVGTGADTAEKLTVGSNGQILIADSGEDTGLKWISLAHDRVVRTAGDLTVASGTFTDVTGMSITMTTGARRVMIAVVAAGAINAIHEMMLDIDIDGSRQGQTFGLCFKTGLSASENCNLSFTYITDVLSAGSHTFKLQFARTTSGTFTLFASTGVSPLVMAAVELPN